MKKKQEAFLIAFGKYCDKQNHYVGSKESDAFEDGFNAGWKEHYEVNKNATPKP